MSPVLFLPHGGGPLPLLGDPGHAALVRFLGAVAADLGRPAAILVISAHWEASVPTLTGGAHPRLIYDYSGFPEESYSIEYPAPGDPALAADIRQMLQTAGLTAELEAARGFDHGVFVPLRLVYPQADIPCVQLSLVRGLDPALHIRLGRALAGLRQRNVLVVGSGFSFHNLRAFFTSRPGVPDPDNDAFQDWLVETCTAPGLPEDERTQRLAEWKQAPHARYCHPRAEHLLPLHVCYGLAGGPARVVFDAGVLGKRAIGLLW
ncbi:MAG: class III extradiol ring-cleavage dioxygenase [Gammaproteobacteria bacterium]|jgi:aromatic ring-opening dioxygenase catalytic subunit (LigB family)